MHDKDKEEIRQLFEQTLPSIVRAGDVPAYLKLLTKDIIWCPPNAMDRHGLTGVEEGFTAMLVAQSFDPTFMAEEIEVIGSFGYVLGHTTIIIHPKDGSPSTVAHSSELWLLRKEHGGWKMARMMWNLKPQ